VAEKKLSRPDDRFNEPSDTNAIFYGKFNHTDNAAVAAAPGTRPSHPSYGFIID
jgi:Flp pilus assembly secretin CpaC